MRERSDPLVPILGSAVAIVVIGAIGLVFYPRISRWFGPEKASVGARVVSPKALVPVWVCRSVKGVALLVEDGYQKAAAEVLDAALEGGPYHYLRVSVFNFDREDPFILELQDFASPSGGDPARPAASRLRGNLPDHTKTVLNGLGAVESLEVARGRHGQVLLILTADPAARSSFVSGQLIFERREVERLQLAEWRADPNLKQFMDF